MLLKSRRPTIDWMMLKSSIFSLSYVSTGLHIFCYCCFSTTELSSLLNFCHVSPMLLSLSNAVSDVSSSLTASSFHYAVVAYSWPHVTVWAVVVGSSLSPVQLSGTLSNTLRKLPISFDCFKREPKTFLVRSNSASSALGVLWVRRCAALV